MPLCIRPPGRLGHAAGHSPNRDTPPRHAWTTVETAPAHASDLLTVGEAMEQLRCSELHRPPPDRSAASWPLSGSVSPCAIRVQRPPAANAAGTRRAGGPPRYCRAAVEDDVDVFAHDLGDIAILDEPASVELQRHDRWRHGHDAWRARHLPARRRRDRLLPLAEQAAGGPAKTVVTVQRDWGTATAASVRALKYTIEDRGLDGLPQRSRVPPRLQARRAAPLQVHLHRRPLRLDRRASAKEGT